MFLMENSKFRALLSVIIPVYNVEPYLERCIRSVTQQTYRNLEIILVDDGSTDGSGELCDSYAVKDNRIKVVHKENGGLVSARKEGIRRASGKYAAYVDADDWIEQDMYQELIGLAEATDADLITSGLIRDYGTHVIIQNERITPGIYEEEQYTKEFLQNMISMKTFFRQNVFFSAWNKIYKRENLHKWQEEVDNLVNVGEDVALGYFCFLNAKKVVVSGKNYYHYCMRSNSIMGNRKEDELLRYEILFKLIEGQCKKHLDRIPNIMAQARIYEYYLMLLQCTERVVWYKNGILFPFGRVNREDTIVIYGAGRFGNILKKVLEKKLGFQIAAWVDKAERTGIRSIKYLNNVQYDKIIIAVLLADLVLEIRQELLAGNIDEDKILQVNLGLLEDNTILNERT